MKTNLLAIAFLTLIIVPRMTSAEGKKPAAPAAAAPAGAADAAGLATTTKAADLKWMEAKGFPKGVMASLVAGDPTKAAYLVLLRIPAGTVIAPHTHTADEGGTLLSGSGTFGTGAKVDEKAGTEVGAGSTYAIPGKAPHWYKAKTETVIARFGAGAADVVYVNPKDDPRGKK